MIAITKFFCNLTCELDPGVQYMQWCNQWSACPDSICNVENVKILDIRRPPWQLLVHLVELLGYEDTQLHPSLLHEPVHPDTSKYKHPSSSKFESNVIIFLSEGQFQFSNSGLVMFAWKWGDGMWILISSKKPWISQLGLCSGALLNFNRLAYFHSLSQALHWGSIIVILIVGSSSSPLSPFLSSRYLYI